MTILFFALVLCGIIFHDKINKTLFGNRKINKFWIFCGYVIVYASLFAIFAYIDYHNKEVEMVEALEAELGENSDFLYDTDQYVEKELFIGEWVFHDRMGTFKERLTFSKKNGCFYEDSYVPGSGWKNIKIVQVVKKGGQYVYSNKNDTYFIHSNGTITWKCEGYSDVEGNGTYNEREMRTAFNLQR